MSRDELTLTIARCFLHVREAGANAGLRVEAIQKWSGGQKGDSWCAEWATMVLDLVFEGESPIPRMASCQAIRELCESKGWIRDTPNVGDMFFYVDANDHAHHVGIVCTVSPLTGIAGNTSSDGTSANGDRVAEHGISAKVFAAYPR